MKGFLRMSLRVTSECPVRIYYPLTGSEQYVFPWMFTTNAFNSNGMFKSGSGKPSQRSESGMASVKIMSATKGGSRTIIARFFFYILFQRKNF